MVDIFLHAVEQVELFFTSIVLVKMLITSHHMIKDGKLLFCTTSSLANVVQL